MDKIYKDMGFILEVDKMKSIMRMTSPVNSQRREDDAQHSWHVALSAMVLEEYCNEEIDVNKVIKMLLVHDLVEIYAGDTFCYDEEGKKDKEERELEAADKTFGLLGKEKNKKFRALWDEFEEMNTNESKFANALDRIQPMMLNYYNEGGTWKEYSIKKSEVYKRAKPIKGISDKLWKYISEIIEDSTKKGWIKEG